MRQFQGGCLNAEGLDALLFFDIQAMIAPILTGPRTLFDKIWDQHVVHEVPDQHSLLYVDLHLVHEVTSPQAFEGLRSGQPQTATS